MATSVRLKKSVIAMQHVAAVLALAMGVYLFAAYRATGFTIAFAAIGVFNVALAIWTQRNPVLTTDDEGLVLKRAVLSKTVRLPWSKLDGIVVADGKWLDIKVKGEPTIRLLASNLEPAGVTALVDEGRRRA